MVGMDDHVFSAMSGTEPVFRKIIGEGLEQDKALEQIVGLSQEVKGLAEASFEQGKKRENLLLEIKTAFLTRLEYLANACGSYLANVPEAAGTSWNMFKDVVDQEGNLIQCDLYLREMGKEGELNYYRNQEVEGEPFHQRTFDLDTLDEVFERMGVFCWGHITAYGRIQDLGPVLANWEEQTTAWYNAVRAYYMNKIERDGEDLQAANEVLNAFPKLQRVVL